MEGGPNEVFGNYDCHSCKQLTSLKGAAEKVGGDFYCYQCNKLTSLKGAPEYVGESFLCSSCKSLKSLKGAPKEVGWNFIAEYCDRLTSLEGVPEKVGGDIRLSEIINKKRIEKVASRKDSSYFLIQDNKGYYLEIPKRRRFPYQESAEKSLEDLKDDICHSLEVSFMFHSDEGDEYKKQKINEVINEWNFGTGNYGKMLEDMVIKSLKKYI